MSKSLFNPSDVKSIKTQVKARMIEYVADMKEAGLECSNEEKWKYYYAELNKEIATLTYQLIDITNGTDTKRMVKGMLEGINRSHRQLQADFWESIIQLMDEHSKQDDYFFDGRNQHVKLMLTRIIDAL